MQIICFGDNLTLLCGERVCQCSTISGQKVQICQNAPTPLSHYILIDYCLFEFALKSKAVWRSLRRLIKNFKNALKYSRILGRPVSHLHVRYKINGLIKLTSTRLLVHLKHWSFDPHDSPSLQQHSWWVIPVAKKFITPFREFNNR